MPERPGLMYTVLRCCTMSSNAAIDDFHSMCKFHLFRYQLFSVCCGYFIWIECWCWFRIDSQHFIIDCRRRHHSHGRFFLLLPLCECTNDVLKFYADSSVRNLQLLCICKFDYVFDVFGIWIKLNWKLKGAVVGFYYNDYVNWRNWI